MTTKYLVTVIEKNIQSRLSYPRPVHYFIGFAESAQDAIKHIKGVFNEPTFYASEVKV